MKLFNEFIILLTWVSGIMLCGTLIPVFFRCAFTSYVPTPVDFHVNGTLLVCFLVFWLLAYITTPTTNKRG